MTTTDTENTIDFTLLEQYYEILGKEGLNESLLTFNSLMPGYLDELREQAKQEDETAFRRQAHKIKGGCRSLGFTRLGSVMQFLEREEWVWEEIDPLLDTWRDNLQLDYERVESWLQKQSS